ncbi:MAG: hypothetical protein P8J45_04260 [Phycisphaerales bacterium]|jgi:hypothetical protein|nr:hypothetical protein [Phycisphaerales bacterium]
MCIACLSLLLLFCQPTLPFAVQDEQTFTPTADYRIHEVRGWRVLVNPAVHASDPKLERDALELLDNQLYRITRVIPEPALGRLKAVEIWVESEMPRTACMCYHPSKDWLIPNGYNPDKEGTVEVGNARAFLEWTRGQPWMVLHELAHAFHHQEFGFEHEGIAGAHQAMLDSGVYDEVQHIGGGSRRHYALTDPMEYFAETTEALFGTNDFHPFVRSELLEVDPDGAMLVRDCWTRWKPEPSPANAGGTSAPEPQP